MWEMSASNWVDKTILSLRRKYGPPTHSPDTYTQKATALDNSPLEKCL